MSDRVLVPIVEGRGEVAALPLLLRRILHDVDIYDVSIARPVLGKRSQIVLDGELEKRVLIAERDRERAGAILILVDADDDCPVTLAGHLLARAQAATHLPASVVVAVREYEAWFLAGLESLRGRRGIARGAQYNNDPEAPRDAKGALSRCMVNGRRYVEVADQPAFSEVFDYEAAMRRSRSLRKLVDDVRQLAAVLLA